jgi:ABC-type multidrug transport system ATPase subunit
MITLEDATVLFKNKRILSNLNIKINRGDFIFVTGPNGSGKTTFLMLLKGLYLLSSGCLKIDKSIISNEQIALITKNPKSFFLRLTAKENINFFYDLISPKLRLKKSEVQNLIRVLDLEEVMDKEFMSLSSGQSQKLSILRGLLRNPKLLLLDEIFSSLDTSSKNDLRLFLFEYIKSKPDVTVLWITHNVDEFPIKKYKNLDFKNGLIQEGKNC